MKKKCIKCLKLKEKSEFHIQNKKENIITNYCKSCKKEYDKEYRKSGKIQSLYKSKEYRDRKNEYQKIRINQDPRIGLLISAKARAKKNNLPFNLEINDIIIPEFCPLLEIPLERKSYTIERTGFLPNSPSMDKIIPELGYVKGNIMIISMKANAMKYNASLNELKTFAKNILNIFN